MANFNENRLVNRSIQLGSYTGYSPRLFSLTAFPPAPTYTKDYYNYNEVVLPDNFESHGVMFMWQKTLTSNESYVELYMDVDEPGDYTGATAWQPWKKVDVDWPKIDPDTGYPFDQFSDFYSGLAE